MRNLFSYDNDIFSAIAKVADAVTLGMLWLICSVPVFTVGASSAAFYYAYNRCICQKRDYAWKTFFSSFKANFKQATQIWLIALGLMLLAVADCYLLSLMKEAGALVSIMQAVIIALTLFGILWGLYLFPYLSRFENSNKAVMKNCALIALANMPWSMLLAVLFVVGVAGFLFVPLLSLFIPAIYMFLANRILEKIFRKYMSPEDLEAQMQLAQEEVPGRE